MKTFLKRLIRAIVIVSFLAFLRVRMDDDINLNDTPNVGWVDVDGNLRLSTYEELLEYSPKLASQVEDDYQRLYDLASSKTEDFSISGNFSIKDDTLISYYLTANMAIDDVLVTANFNDYKEIYVQTAHHFSIDETPYQTYAKAIAKVIDIDEKLLVSAAKSLYQNQGVSDSATIKMEHVEGDIWMYENSCRFYFVLAN